MTALYGYSYTERALAFLETIQPKLRRQIVKRIEALTSDPTPPGCKKILSKSDDEGEVYRVRQGDHRVLYSIRNNPDQIVILDIGHRKDIYK